MLSRRRCLWLLTAMGMALALGVVTVNAQAPVATPAAAAGRPGTLCFGAYTQWYGFEQALTGWQLKVVNCKVDGAEGFPSAEELAASGVVILSDASGGEFSAEQIAALQAYLEGGGGLLVTGGPFSLGLGLFKEKGIEEWLPVTLEPFDLKWEKAGVSFAATATSPLTAGLDLAGPPWTWWLHRVTPKPGAVVQMQAGSYPLLVTGRYGKGKVAVFTATPLGLPGEGQKPFWEAALWPQLVRNTVNWLAAREG